MNFLTSDLQSERPNTFHILMEHVVGHLFQSKFIRTIGVLISNKNHETIEEALENILDRQEREQKNQIF